MDKIIELIVKNKKVLIATIALVMLTILPAVALVFIWNREMFGSYDLLKILLLSACIGNVLLIINCIFVWNMSVIAEEFERTKLQDRDDDMSLNLLVIATMGSFMVFIECMALCLAKVFWPSVCIKDVASAGVGLTLCGGCLLLLANIIKKFSKKKIRKH